MTISASQRSCLIFSFTDTAMGNDIFKAMSDAIDAMGLGWDKLCGVATDGAPAMTGERKGMASMVFDKVRECGGEAFKFHCIIHQEALCAKTIQPGHVMEVVVKTVSDVEFASQFASTYICEQVFSVLNLNKNKFKKIITDDNLWDTIRIATTKVIPNLKSIIQRKQLHPSH